MTLRVVTRTTLERYGTDIESDRFTMTLKDGTVLHGTTTWPHYPSHRFALDPRHYPDAVVAGIDNAYEQLIARVIARDDADLAADPNCFDEQFAALSPRERAEQVVDRSRIEAVIETDVVQGCPEVIVNIGYPYSGEYFGSVTYASPIAKLTVE